MTASAVMLLPQPDLADQPERLAAADLEGDVFDGVVGRVFAGEGDVQIVDLEEGVLMRGASSTADRKCRGCRRPEG